MVPLPVPVLQGIPQAVFIGHDWGGAVVWNMALFYPERVRWVHTSLPFWGQQPSLQGVPHCLSSCRGCLALLPMVTMLPALS